MKIGNRCIYITVEEKCYAIWVGEQEVRSTEAEELFSNQEEADTKTILCCKHAELLRHRNVCIVTVDSDIAIYTIFFAGQFNSNLYVRIGSKNSTRILNIKAIHANIGPYVASFLLALHAFTGCDYTSAFHGIGKVKAFIVLKKDERFHYAFGIIGDDFRFDQDVF